MRPSNRIHQLLAQNVGTATPMQVKQAADETEILVYDVIDPFWGISAKAFAEALSQVRGAVTIRINSPGGDVFEGRAIASQIRAHAGPTRTVVDGLAASAASTIAIAAKKVEMSAGSFLMIHRSWTLALGNANDLVQTAALLEKIDDALATDYAQRTKRMKSEALAWMDAETWFTADEAVEAGLADRAIDVKAQMQAWNLSAYDNPPEALIAPGVDPDDDDAASLLKMRAHAERRIRLYG